MEFALRCVFFNMLQEKKQHWRFGWRWENYTQSREEMAGTLKGLRKVSAKKMGKEGCQKEVAMERLYAKDWKREKSRGSDHWCVQTTWEKEVKSLYLSIGHLCLPKGCDPQSFSMWRYQWHNRFTFSKWIYNYAWNLGLYIPEKCLFFFILKCN